MLTIEDLFKLYYRPLCMYAIGQLHDVNYAEDVVMDCYVKFWNRQKHSNDIADVKSYLYLMVRNACYDFNRNSQKAMPSIDLNIVENKSEQDDDECFSEIAANLWTAIDSLPQQCRRIFLMSKRDGMKYSDIAQELGLSVKTIETQVSKAYKILRGKAKEIYFFILSLFG